MSATVSVDPTPSGYRLLTDAQLGEVHIAALEILGRTVTVPAAVWGNDILGACLVGGERDPYYDICFDGVETAADCDVIADGLTSFPVACVAGTGRAQAGR